MDIIKDPIIISKSPNDTNQYRYLSLENGIKAFLISNPQASSSHTNSDEVEKKTKTSAFHHFKEYSKSTKSEAKIKHKIEKKALQEEADEEEEEDSGSSDLDKENGDIPDIVKEFLEKKQGEMENEVTNEESKTQGISSIVVLIESGSANEPKKFHGLAHLLEHVIFLGCKEFPEQDSFSQFISNNGGSDNGRTSLDYTFFDFNIENEHLSEALYRFSRLLKEPLFPEDGIAKELKAVNNEFELSQTSDGSRNFQILLNHSHPESKYNSFSWGSILSLNYENHVLREEIMKYFKKFYCNDKIKICVYSKFELDVLQQFVEKSFGDLKNWGDHLNPNNQTEYSLQTEKTILTTEISNLHDKNLNDLHRSYYSGMYYVETVKNEHLLILSWALKPFFHHNRTRAIYPIINLLNEEGPQSVCTFLKKGNLINSLYAYIDDDDCINSLFFLFTIEIDLTEEGVDKWCEIIVEIFKYIDLIKESPGVPQFYLNQLKILSNMSFLYADEEHPACMIEKLAFLMTFVEPRDLILIYSEIYLEWNQEYYKEILDQLVLNNCRFTLMTKKETFPQRITLSLEEKWFGTKYYKENLDDFLISYLQTLPKTVNRYNFPKENPYLPSKLEILPFPSPLENIPKIIYSNDEENKNPNHLTPKLKCWHYFDSKELKPKVCIEMIMIYRSINESLADQVNLEFFIEYFSEKFNEVIGFESSEAEICFEASPFEGKGISFSVYGYFDKMQIFLEKTINFFVKICLDDIESPLFYQIKNKTLKDLKNYALDTENQLQESINNFLFPDYFFPEYFEEILKDYELKDFQEFCAKNMQSYENLFSITAYFHGNIYLETSKQIFQNYIDILKTKLQNKRNISKGLITKEFLCKKVLVLPSKLDNWSKILISTAKNEGNKNSMIIKFIDFGKYDLVERNKLSLLLSLLSPQTHEYLRMKKQVGYLANASLSDIRNRLGVCIIVNSSEKNFEQISQEIEEFIQYFCENYLEVQLTENEFNNFVNGLIAKKLEVIKNMKLNCAKFWCEIVLNELMFDRIKKNVEILKGFQFKEIKKWIKEKMRNKDKEVLVGVVPKGTQVSIENQLGELLKQDRKKYYESFEFELYNYEFY